jgi:hypothetical protein
MTRGLQPLPLTVLLLIALPFGVGTGTPNLSTGLSSPGFHHIHMNSVNPGAAVAELLAVYPASAKVTIAGFEGLRAANDVYMLFTKVNVPPPAPGPDRVGGKAPQTAFWHHVWAAADGRSTLESLRKRDPAFDRTRMIRQYTGPDGLTVDFSSDTFPGFLTSAQVDEAKRNGAQPTHKGGYFNWYGPDGVVMETADGPSERYTIVGMFEEQPYCALYWYRRHLLASDRPAGRQSSAGGQGGADIGRSASSPSEADCRVSRGPDISWPSTYKRGHHRVPPPQLVYFGNVTLRWYMNQEDQPLISTRGQLMDHIALSVTDLDAWIRKLSDDNVKFLEQPYHFGEGRAVMIEGPSLEAIELVETKN